MTRGCGFESYSDHFHSQKSSNIGRKQGIIQLLYNVKGNKKERIVKDEISNIDQYTFFSKRAALLKGDLIGFRSNEYNTHYFHYLEQNEYSKIQTLQSNTNQINSVKRFLGLFHSRGLICESYSLERKNQSKSKAAHLNFQNILHI